MGSNVPVRNQSSAVNLDEEVSVLNSRLLHRTRQKNNAFSLSVLEITVGHQTLSDQILIMSGQFHIMIGHDDQTCHQHILSSLLQGVVSQ